jgi:thiol-disulfide isomerase/thioredoxin
MFPFRFCFVMTVAITTTIVAPVGAQSAKKANNQRNAGLRPGEVTTPAARTERRPETLAVGDIAPSFTLQERTGERTYTLSAFRDQCPVVLVFGSLTCPPFRREVPQLERLFAEYGDRVEFFLVYLREAHPDSVVAVTRDGKDELLRIGQTDDWAGRAKHAELCTTTLKLTFPALVDNDQNEVRDAYAGWPSRLMVVGKDGKVAYDGGRGPRGFQPAALEAWLKTQVGPPRTDK